MPNHMPSRKSIRLTSYDYRVGGAYFVTIVTASRQPSFGRIIEATFVSSPLGDIAAEQWDEMGRARHDHVALDAFVVMPNHVHGVLFIETASSPGEERRRFGSPQPRSLSTIIGGYKSAVPREAATGATVWQRGFYEHVIRNDGDLQRVRRYIAENPAKWDLDEHHV